VVDILTQIESIFQDVLDNPRLGLTRESNTSNVKGWDSLAHMNLILAIEQQFGVSFSLRELGELKDVGGMVDLVEQKLAKR